MISPVAIYWTRADAITLNGVSVIVTSSASGTFIRMVKILRGFDFLTIAAVEAWVGDSVAAAGGSSSGGSGHEAN
jgi:hypothetical protein